METYYFFLDKSFCRVIRCKDPNTDGLELFEKEVKKDGRFSIEGKTIKYKKL